MKTYRNSALVIIALFLSLSQTSCIETFTGTYVALNLDLSVRQAKEGQHYEIFMTINDSVVSLKAFIITDEIVECAGGVETSQWVVRDYFKPTEQIGVLNQSGCKLPIGGISFLTPIKLEEAKDVFITIENDNDLDPTPSDKVVARGELYPGPRGVYTTVLYAPGQEGTDAGKRGAFTIVPAEDNTF